MKILNTGKSITDIIILGIIKIKTSIEHKAYFTTSNFSYDYKFSSFLHQQFQVLAQGKTFLEFSLYYPSQNMSILAPRSFHVPFVEVKSLAMKWLWYCTQFSNDLHAFPACNQAEQMFMHRAETNQHWCHHWELSDLWQRNPAPRFSRQWGLILWSGQSPEFQA